jgi:hypothetical protein
MRHLKRFNVLPEDLSFAHTNILYVFFIYMINWQMEKKLQVANHSKKIYRKGIQNRDKICEGMRDNTGCQVAFSSNFLLCLKNTEKTSVNVSGNVFSKSQALLTNCRQVGALVVAYSFVANS